MTSTTLYHYCSIEAFVSIISTRTIRLSILKQSNDSQEGRWIIPVLRNHIDQARELASIKEKLIHLIETSVEFLTFAGFCLSEHRDLLSQWRGYADDGRGVSIGFSKPYLEKMGSLPSIQGSGISLTSVTYGEPNQDSQLMEVLNEILKRAKHWGVCNKGALILAAREDLKEQYERATSSLIIALAPLMLIGHKYKNPAFSEEREWRLISVLTPYNGSGLSVEKVCEFRSAGNLLVPYRPVHLAGAEGQAIQEVVLGPRNLSREEDVHAILKKYGFNDVKVVRSAATYRGFSS